MRRAARMGVRKGARIDLPQALPRCDVEARRCLSPTGVQSPPDSSRHCMPAIVCWCRMSLYRRAVSPDSPTSLHAGRSTLRHGVTNDGVSSSTVVWASERAPAFVDIGGVNPTSFDKTLNTTHNTLSNVLRYFYAPRDFYVMNTCHANHRQHQSAVGR
jgi:hypothetical protein